eukprot:Opistho-2@64608
MGYGDGCYRCGRTSHWASDCYASTRAGGGYLGTKAYSSSKDDVCLRCGRASHWARDCYAKTDTAGTPLASADSGITKRKTSTAKTTGKVSSAGASAVAAASKSVYVLELKKGRVYVGKSSNVSARVSSHQSGDASTYTRQNEPTGRVLRGSVI